MVIYCHCKINTVAILFYNTECQQYHGMNVNYHCKKSYEIGTRSILWDQPQSCRASESSRTWGQLSARKLQLWFNRGRCVIQMLMLSTALGATKFITNIIMNRVTLKSDSDVKQTHLRSWFVEQMLMLSRSFSCNQVYNKYYYELGHAMLSCSSPT
jgi:hypothetical protein